MLELPMLLHIPDVLSREQVIQMRASLDWPGDELREQRHIQRKIDEVAQRLHPLPIHVDRVT